MKISIGTNTFQNFHRQNVAVESWYELRNKFGINLYDFQFKDEENSFTKHYDLNTCFTLNRSSKDILETNKKLPYVNDIISSLANIDDSDYFIFTNSDVIIMPSLIKEILAKQPECMSCSRLDINEISNFKNLKEEASPVRWEIAGFDTFVFRRDWYSKHKKLFRDYFLGRPIWDVVYTGHMKLNSKHFELANHNPPHCMHLHHGIAACTTDTPERTFNLENCDNDMNDKYAVRVMGCYIHMFLINRSQYGSFLVPLEGERKLEEQYFNHFRL